MSSWMLGEPPLTMVGLLISTVTLSVSPALSVLFRPPTAALIATLLTLGATVS